VTAAATTVLLAGEPSSLRRWVAAAALVAAAHAALILWLMQKRDAEVAGAPEAAILIDLPPAEVPSAPETPPAVTEGPQMKEEAPPEEAAPPQTTAVPELPPAKKPAAVLTTVPKPKPQPKKIIKELPKPAEKQSHEPPAPRTSAPKKNSGAAQGQAAAPPRQGAAGSAASAVSWRAQIFSHLLQFKPGGTGGTGTVSISFTLARSGRLVAAHLAGSSGSSDLDNKALEMVRRANPFPAAPPEVSGGSFPFVVPVRFH
jgi:periplasmic protein TonB